MQPRELWLPDILMSIHVQHGHFPFRKCEDNQSPDFIHVCANRDHAICPPEMVLGILHTHKKEIILLVRFEGLE